LAGPPTLELLQTGTGDILPLGRPAGIQVAIDPGDLEPGNYLLEWETETPDGDTLLWQRAIPLAGQPTRAWVYGVAPPRDASPGRIRLRHPDDAGSLVTAPVGRIGGSLQQVPEGGELMLVVGDQRHGLESYDSAAATSMATWSHIDSYVRAVMPDDLPDRPEGLSAASTVLWTGEHEVPDAHRESVMRDWMESGGHLIVSLPDQGRADRFARSGGPLHELLPPIPPRETVYASQIAPLVSPDQLRTSPGTEMTCRSFPPNGEPWHTVLNRPDGRPLVIARPVGHGRLTLIGLDLTSQRLRNLKGSGAGSGPLPAAATFWNSILARRGAAPTPAELKAMGWDPRDQNPSWPVVIGDEAVSFATRRTVAAGSRLSIVMLWLGLCWLLGGPVLWILLRRLHLERLAWPAFAVLSASGAALGWSAGMVLSLQDAEAVHMSIVDQVSGSPDRLIRSWLDLRVPGTSTHDVGVSADESRGLLAPWIPSTQTSIGFADADTLVTDVDHPETLPIKARSTSTGIQLEWIGPVAPSDALPSLEIVHPVHVTPDGLEGTLRYTGPSPLTDVTIVWVQARQYPREAAPKPWTDPADAGHMPTITSAWKLSQAIMPGQTFSVQNHDPPDLSRFLADHITSSHRNSYGMPTRTRTLPTSMDLLGLYRLATPPQWNGSASTKSAAGTGIQRSFGSQLDFGPRLGSPMLSVSGFASDTDLPVQLTLDGNPVQATNGLTLLRWMMTLPDVSPVLEQPGPSR
jgi:hypothetical protein